jgi:hypothetical protein
LARMVSRVPACPLPPWHDCLRRPRPDPFDDSAPSARFSPSSRDKAPQHKVQFLIAPTGLGANLPKSRLVLPLQRESRLSTPGPTCPVGPATPLLACPASKWCPRRPPRSSGPTASGRWR